MKRGFVVFVLLLFISPSGVNLYISDWNIFADVFNDPFESCVMVLNDGKCIQFSTHDSDRIAAGLYVFEFLLEKHGRTLNEVVIIMHNHFAIPRFSEPDIKTYNYLRERGFTGSFGIYITATGKIYLHKGVEDDGQ